MTIMVIDYYLIMFMSLPSLMELNECFLELCHLWMKYALKMLVEASQDMKMEAILLLLLLCYVPWK
jgi:hypothetical protein